MSFIIAIIVLSILKLTFTIGRFVAAKRLKLPVEKFIIGIDWGKPIFAKKFQNTEFIIYPIFYGGYLEYEKDFDPEVKCSDKQKAFLTCTSLLTMMISVLLIGLVYINYVPSGKWETSVTAVNKGSQLQKGDKIININGFNVNEKNTLNTVLQNNRKFDGIVSTELVDYYKNELIKLNRGKFKNGEIAANIDISLPKQLSEGKITKRLPKNTINLDEGQTKLRKNIAEGITKFDAPIQLHDLATALADSYYDVIITVERDGKNIILAPLNPNELGNIGAEYQVKTIYLPREEVLKNFSKKTQTPTLEKPKTQKEKFKDFTHNLASIFAMLALISILVLVHEAGHYLAARMFKIKVEKFGFGLPFGPILWQKQCGETLVVVHAFLLGGYVSFPDDEKNSGLAKNSPERFANKPIYQRLVVVSAGVFANVVCAVVIVILTALLWGKLPTEKYQTFIKNINTKENISLLTSGIQAGDKIIEINGSTIDTNYAFQLYAIKSKKFDGKISTDTAEKNLVNLLKLNPKFNSNELLPAGTVIKLPKSINEEDVKLTDDMLRGFERIADDNFSLTDEQVALRNALQGKKQLTVIGATLTLTDIAYAMSDNAPALNIKIERAGKFIELPAIYSDDKGIVGVELDKQRGFVETKNLKSATIESWNYLYGQTKILLKGLWQLFSGKVPLDNMHGVVAVVKYGGDVIQQDGFFQGLLLIALISLDLAIVNFLPIPALDGGHVVFLMLEKINGKPLDEETVNNIATIGFMFLILLMVIVLYNDITALLMHKI